MRIIRVGRYMGLLKKEFIIKTEKSKEEILDAVRKKTDERNKLFVVRYEKDKEFVGRVYDEGFTVKSIKGLSRQYNPLITGRLLERSVVIIIEPSMWMTFSVISLFIIFVISLFILITSILNNFYINGLTIFLILNCVNLINYLYFLNKINYSKNKIVEIIKDKTE